MNKTWAELRQSGAATYPEEIPEALQLSIDEWYQFREVADDIKTPVFVNRILNRDYTRYNQLLRIEAGVSTYDWLVQNYRERQTYTHDIGETSDNNTITGTKSETTETTKGGTHTNAHTGTITDRVAYGHDISTQGTKTENVERTPELSETITDTRTKSTSGGYTDNHTDGRVISDVKEIQTMGNDDSTTERKSWQTKVDKSLQKDNPMSISYVGGIQEPASGNNAQGAGATSGSSLDWTNPSAQGQQYGKLDDGEIVKEHQGHIKETNTHTETGNPEINSRVYNSLTDTHGGTLTTAKSGTETIETTKGDDTIVSHGGTDTSTKTLLNTDTLTIDDSDSVENSGSTSQTVRNSGTDENERLLQEVYTGRDEDPATLLKRAADYILRTDAFEWLCKELDICFMGVYD